MQIARYNSTELFTVELRKVLPSLYDYIEFFSHIFLPLTGSKLLKEEIQNSDIINFLIDTTLRAETTEHASNKKLKVVAMIFLKDIWKTFPLKFDQDASLGNNLLSFMKRSSRDHEHHIRYIVVTQLFDLLTHFANDRNPYAPIIYKTLIFSLIENAHDPQLKQYVC